MKRIIFSSLFMLVFSLSSYAQSKTNDISISQLPPEVKAVLDEYIKILNTSQSLDECATRFTAIAGGGLVNEDGLSLRSTIQPYSLKKDYDNLKFYKVPILITRVNKSPSNGSGYGPSAIKGQVYKVWISKKDGGAGLPAPISIMVPEGHPTITTPKIVGIGSL